jgi:hypothetical protein
VRTETIGFAASVVSGVVACALAVLPQLQFTYNGALLHVAVETAASLIALLAGFLVFGRLRRRGSVNDLLLACALVVFVLLNLRLLTMPTPPRSRLDDLDVWTVLVGRSLGCVLFALAAFASLSRLWRPVLALVVSVAGMVAIVLLLAAALSGVPEYVALQLTGTSAPDPPEVPAAGVHPALLTVQLVTAALYGVAAAGR